MRLSFDVGAKQPVASMAYPAASVEATSSVAQSVSSCSAAIPESWFGATVVRPSSGFTHARADESSPGSNRGGARRMRLTLSSAPRLGSLSPGSTLVAKSPSMDGLAESRVNEPTSSSSMYTASVESLVSHPEVEFSLGGGKFLGLSLTDGSATKKNERKHRTACLTSTQMVPVPQSDAGDK